MALDRPGSRYDHIDALRAIAALSVVYVHSVDGFTEVTGIVTWPRLILGVLNAGRIGVSIFFLVSGFVIPSSLDRGGPKGPIVAAFAVRRLFRLYPLYWLSIPFGLLTGFLLWERPVDWAMAAANFTMVQEYLGYASAEAQYWTLHSELVFYLLCVLLFLSGGLCSNAAIALLALFLLALFVGGSLAEGTILADWTVQRLAGNLSLMLTGTLFRRWHDGALTEPASRVGAAAVIAFWLAGATLLTGAPSYSIAMVVFLIGTFVIRIQHPAVVAIGRASYSLYIFHSVLYWPVIWLFIQPQLGLSAGTAFGLEMLIAPLLSLGAALLLYRFVEVPMIETGRMVADRWLKPPVVEAI